MWACIETYSVGIEDGERKNYKTTKFLLKIKESDLSFSGDTIMGKGTLGFVVKGEGVFVYSGYSDLINFNLKTKTFAWVVAFNHKTPSTISKIGTCEKFDDPE